MVLFMSAILVVESGYDIYSIREGESAQFTLVSIGTQLGIHGDVHNQSIFGFDENFSGSRPAVGDVPRLLQLSRVVHKSTTGCSQVLVNEHLVASTCIAVLELKPGAVHVISHLLTGESDGDRPVSVTRFAVPIQLWPKTVASLDLLFMYRRIRAHFVVD